MHHLLRDLLLFAAAACFLTLAASAAAWWMEQDRRLRRSVLRGLGGARPDAVIAGHGRCAALDLQGGRIALAWDGGGLAAYDLDELVGAELIADGLVAGRAFRDEARRTVDRIPAEARQVVLRLVFDDPREPDFQILLWRADAPGGAGAAAVEEGRRWLARAEAIVRRPRTLVPSRAETKTPADESPAGVWNVSDGGL